MAAPPILCGLAFLFVKRTGFIGVLGAALAGTALCYGLLAGGFLGLAAVPTELWGGLSLTLLIAYAGISASIPLGIILALARRSSWPVIHGTAVIFIEFWRGVPLVTVLFMASFMLPLFLPEGATSDKLGRAIIAVSLFASAYMAEVVRGGLQSIRDTQFQSADALGFTYAQTLRYIILPQALRNALPGIIGTCIGLLKDTTLVLVIGLFDFLGMVQLASTDAAWAAPSTALTGYVFAAMVFWFLCFGLSRVGASLERQTPRRR
jgi:general L-amino acid transport system permease protein